MIKKKCYGLLLILFFLTSSSYAVNSFSIKCPANLQVSQSLTNKYPGWRSLVIQPRYYLSNVTFYSGKPEELASLIPDSSTQKNAVWNFSSNDQIYLTCEYNQTSIQLTQKLPKSVTQCQVWYDPSIHSGDGNYSIPIRIVCDR